MSQMGNVVTAWLPLIVFQQVDAPRYYKGWITVCAINASLIISTLVTWQLQKRELAKQVLAQDSLEENSQSEETADYECKQKV
jgi:ACS family pantothenate transporter-like MFS transporter